MNFATRLKNQLFVSKLIFVLAAIIAMGGFFTANQALAATTKLKTQSITITKHASLLAIYNSTFSVAATSNSGLTVSLAVDGGCSLNGDTVTMTSGSVNCVIKYDQAGNDTYKPASEKTETVLAVKSGQTISFNDLPDTNYGKDFNVSANSDSGLPVKFSSIGTCDISGTLVHLTSIGICIITASQSGDDNYKTALPVIKSFTIKQLPIVLTGTRVYDGTKNVSIGMLSMANKVSGDDLTLTGSGAILASANIGNQTIVSFGKLKLSGKSFLNYTLDNISGSVIITAYPLIVTAQSNTKIYDGNTSAAAIPLITSGSLQGSDTASFVESYNDKNAGTGKVLTPSAIINDGNGGQNYLVTLVNGIGDVNALPITVIADSQNKIYGDTDPNLTYHFASSSLLKGDYLSGTLTRVSGENVGLYSINQGTLANANYDVTYIPAALTITAKSITVTADAKGKNYGDSDPDLTYQITGSPLVSGDSFNGSLTRDSGEDVGVYAIAQGSLSLSNNYNLTFVGSNFTISQFLSVINVTVDAQSKYYGDPDPKLTYTVSPALKDGDSFSGALSRAAGENVGNYAIAQGTLTAGPDYNLTFTGNSLTIKPKLITVTVDSQSKTYGDSDPALTYTSSDSSVLFSGSLSRKAGEDAGVYAIEQNDLSVGANYSIDYVEANLTIKVKPITVTADNQSMIIGQSIPALTYKITDGSLVGKDEFSGSLSCEDATAVTTYPITQGSLALNGNYALTVIPGTLTVDAAAPNIVSVAAIDDINVANGTSLGAANLPATVNVNLSDGTIKQLNVVWDGGLPIYDGNTTGKYAFAGTIVLPDDITNINSVKAYVNVIVAAAEVENNVSAPSLSGGNSSLPDCTAIVYGDWGSCVNGVQYRTISNPTNVYCSFTAIQKTAESQTCGATASVASSSVLGVKIYAVGTLLRAPGGRVYVVTATNTIQYIPTPKALAAYHGHPIFAISYADLAKYKQVLGVKIYTIGSLIRGSDHKIFVITKNGKKHILTLKELAKYYFGLPIHNVSDDVVAQY